MSETILTRRASFFPFSFSTFSPFSDQVDEAVGLFLEQATDPKVLASMTAAGLAFRLGRVAGFGTSALRVSSSLRFPISYALGFGSEVLALEFTNRTLHSLWATRRSPLQSGSPDLWSWSGPGGWKEGLSSSALTFGMLRGIGYLAREQNIIVQHAFQSFALVLGHQSASLLGIVPKSSGSFGEQILHAEVTTLQMGAGMGLVQSLAPNLGALERALDLSSSRMIAPHFPGKSPRWTFQGAEVHGVIPENLESDPLSIRPLLMSSNKKEGDGTTVSDSLPKESSTPWQHRTLKTLGKRLGVEIPEEERETPLSSSTQIQIRSRVMDLISLPEIKDHLPADIIGELRLFVVSGWSQDPKLFTPLYRLYKAAAEIGMVHRVPEKVPERTLETQPALEILKPEEMLLGTTINRPGDPRQLEASVHLPGIGEASAVTLPAGHPGRNDDAFGIGGKGVLIVADGVSESDQGDFASASAVETVLRHMRNHGDLLGLAMMEAHEKLVVSGYGGQTVASAVQVKPDGRVEAAIAGDVELWILLHDGHGNYEVIPYASPRVNPHEPPSVVLGGPHTPRLVDEGPPGGPNEIVRRTIPRVSLEDPKGSEGFLRLNEGDGLLLMSDGVAKYYHQRSSMQMADLISGQTTADGIRRAIQADATGRLETLFWRQGIRYEGEIRQPHFRDRFKIPEGWPMAGHFIDGIGAVYAQTKEGSAINYFGEQDNQTVLAFIYRPSPQSEVIKTPAKEKPGIEIPALPPESPEDDESTPAFGTVFNFEANSREELIRRYVGHFERDGFFVQNSRIPTGTDLRFEIRLKSGETVLAGRGLVAWSRSTVGSNRRLPPGMFVQILDLVRGSHPFFQQILNAKKKIP
jgi:hypothetical protein